jgi:hypothetical protein
VDGVPDGVSEAFVALGVLGEMAAESVRRRDRLRDTSVAAVIGASFGVIAARLTAYLAMRDDVNAIRANVRDGLAIADEIDAYPAGGAAPVTVGADQPSTPGVASPGSTAEAQPYRPEP